MRGDTGIQRSWWRWCAALVLLAGLLAGWLPAAGTARAAATCVVANRNDSGAGSLRQCLADVDTGGTVTFGVGVTGTLTLTGGDLGINRDVTLQGPGASLLTISANHVGRAFSITGGAVAISDLTITDGNTDAGGGIAVFNAGTSLTLAGAVVRGNTAAYGGGLYDYGAAVTVTDSTISDNTATNQGGGIYADAGATLVAANSTFSGNGAGGNGGAIRALSAGTTVSITGSTFDNNTATNVGGGIEAANFSTLTVANSTFRSNTATNGGGGIEAFDSTATVAGSTFSLNTAAAGGGLNAEDASLIARNTIVTGSDPGCGGVTDGGHNLDSGNSCGFSSANGSRSNADLRLDPAGLADNGGPTRTIRLLGGSSAIDAGDNAACAAAPTSGVDQRGAVRPQGAGCDIGAYEVAAILAVPTLVGATPSTAPVADGGAADLPVILTGTGFQPDGFAVATLDGTPLATTYTDGTHLTAQVPATLRAVAGQYALTVRNGPPAGGLSNPLTFTVTNPAPTLESLSPTGVTAGAGDTSLTLASTGGTFAPGATVGFGGTTLTPIAATATQLTVTIPAALLANARTVGVTVTNPGPGGGTSGVQSFTVSPPPAAPAQASVAPASLTFGERQIGTASDSQQVTVTNGGDSALAITGVTLGGANPGDFAMTFNTCTGTIPAGASCVVGVRFAPTAAGGRSATLQLADSAAGSPQIVALTGTGTTPPASPIPQSVVTASASGGGTVTPSGSTSYATGGTATYAAVPATGQVFVGWTLDGQYVGYASPLTFTVDADRTLVATFAARPTFSDVPPSDPDYQAITTLAALGIVNPAGVNGSGQFQPAVPVKRAEVAAFLARTFGWAGEFHGNSFPDKCDPTGANCVDDRLWNDVAALKDYGVVGGYNDPATCQALGTTAPCYDPRGNVLKLQVVSIVARAFTKAPDLRPTGFWDRLAANASQYTNVPDAGSQRSDLTTYRANAGAIPGQTSDATFPQPTDPATRRFIIQVLWQAYSAQFGVDRVP